MLSATALLAACGSTTNAREVRQNPNPGAPERVVATSKTVATLKHPYATVAELARSTFTTLIVVGTVRAVEYSYPDRVSTTRFTVDITKTLKGTAAGRIVVNEDGGYVDARLIQAEIKEKFPDKTITAKPGEVVENRFEDAGHPVTGQEVLLFLHEDPNHDHAGEFGGVMSALSRFTSTDGAHFTRSASNAGLEAETTLDAVVAVLR